ncbi:transporter substrate-binding domain-containing protein [Sphaerisporangium dianthi]|uniref:Transporter substrate-binding domain-containing protein n=1 Tax=Sphaerisporangium dianthi TaxID=1436120 RepID=A0ABV9CIL1_9ACTN
MSDRPEAERRRRRWTSAVLGAGKAPGKTRGAGRVSREPEPEPVPVPEPEPLAAVPAVTAADRVRGLRLLGWVTAVVLAVVVAAWAVWVTGPPTEADLRAEAGLLGRRELLIGVKDDTPGISLRNSATGRFAGFDIEVAYLIAAELGFTPGQVRFLAIETEDRERMQAREADGRFVTVDLVVATFSITPARLGNPGVSFSAPYLENEQSVVTGRKHGRVTALGDLRGEKVCTLGTSTSETQAAEAGAVVTGKNRISECIAGLKKGDFDAVTTDAAILAGFVSAEPSVLRHHDIGLTTSEKWGVNTGTNKALRTLVDLALYRSYADPKDRRWEDAFDRYLGAAQKTNRPQQVAVGEQPRVAEPQVRRWPWERTVPRR